MPPDKERMIGYGRYDLVLDTLEGAVSHGDYLAGNAFTAADVHVGSHLGLGMQFGRSRSARRSSAYWQRLSARPAAVRARQIDDALMPPKPTAGQ